MKSFKKVLSVVLALSMVLTMMTTINVSAADGDTNADIIYEDFGDGFVIDNTNKTITTDTEGLSITADAGFYEFSPAVNNGALEIKGFSKYKNVEGTSSASAKVMFPKVTEGKVEVSLDLSTTRTGMTNWFSTLGAFLCIGDSETGDRAAELHARGMTTNADAYPSEIYLASASGSRGTTDNVIGTLTSVMERITYVFDFTNHTYDVIYGGEEIKGIPFKNTDITGIDCIEFRVGTSQTANQNIDILADNLTVVKNPEDHQSTITFEGVDGIDPVTTTYGRGVTLPVPEVPGIIFRHWNDENGNALGHEYVMTDDVTLTAETRAIAEPIYEDFGSDFVIDNANKTITTGTAGLTVTAHDKIFALNKLAVTDEGLKVPNPSGDGDNKDVTFTFDPIAEGVTEISFDLNVYAVGISHNSTLGLLKGTQADGVTVKDANQSFSSPAQTGASGFNIFFGDKLIAPQGKKFRATYIIDFTNNTIETLVDGESIDTRAIKNNVTSIDTLTFFDNWNPDAYYIDNLTIVKDTEYNQSTITFEGVDGIDPITTTYGREVILPLPEVEGKIFGGWIDENGEEYAGKVLLTDDMTLTADIRDISVFRETFDNFKIDYANKKITTDSGFTVSAHENAFADPANLAVEDGALKVIGMDSGQKTGYDTDVYFDFPAIISGTAKISLDINPIRWGTSGGHNGGIFAIGDENMTYFSNQSVNPASQNSIACIENSTSAFGKGLVLNGTGLKAKWTGEWVKVEFIITMPEGDTPGSYDVYIDGVLAAEDVAFNNQLESISRIIICQNPNNFEGFIRNSNNYFDNITLIENIEANSKKITFVDADNGTEDVKSVALYGDLAMPIPTPVNGRIFLGWFTAENGGIQLTADMLKNIAADATYYARFRDRVNLKETFGDDFTINREGASATAETTSGFDITLGADAIYPGVVDKTEDGAIALHGNYDVTSNSEKYSKDEDAKRADLYLDFPDIRKGSGKTYISFKIKKGLFWNPANNSGHNPTVFAIGNEGITDGNSYGGTSIIAYKSENKSGDVSGTYIKDYKTGNVTALDGSNFNKIEFLIDMDNNTYKMAVNGEWTEDMAFLSDLDVINRIAFPQTPQRYRNNNFFVDDVTVIESYDATTDAAGKHLVQFKNIDGTMLYFYEVEDGQMAVYPNEAPTYTAEDGIYTFKGWDKSLANITAPTIFTAQYNVEKYTYTVTFYDQNGAVIGEAQTVIHGESAIAPEAPAVDGYTFKGWDKAFNNVKSNLDVYAQYEANGTTEPDPEPPVEEKPYNFITEIEPMSLADAAAITGDNEADLEGFYAWKVSYSIDGIQFSKSGSARKGYTGNVLNSTQLRLQFRNGDVYEYAMPIEGASALKDSEMQYGYGEGTKQFNIGYIALKDPAKGYPYDTTGEVTTGLDNALVFLLLTKTDTFDVDLLAEVGVCGYYVENGEQQYPEDIRYCSNKLNASEGCWAGLKPAVLSVVNGVVQGGVEEPENPGVTIIWGDIDGNGIVEKTDGEAIIDFTYGGKAVYKDKTINTVFAGGLLWGDIDGNGIVDATDGTAIINFMYGGTATYSGKTINANIVIE